MMMGLFKSLILIQLIAIFGIKLLLFYYESHDDETGATLPHNNEASPPKSVLAKKGLPYVRWLSHRLDRNKHGRVKVVSYIFNLYTYPIRSSFFKQW